MQQKILVATHRSEERELMEEILTEFLDRGGELLFAKTRQEALDLMQQEPQLIFLDNSFVGDCDDWVQEKVHIILMREPTDNSQHGEDFVDRPLKAEQVLEKCRATIASLTSAHTPPM